MHWRDSLADAIHRWNRDESGHKQYYTIPSSNPGESLSYAVVTNDIRLIVGPMSYEQMSKVTNCVNEDSIGEGKPGTIVISGGRILFNKNGTPNASLLFIYRDRPWNEFPTPDGRWETLRDRKGNLAYPEIRFADLS